MKILSTLCSILLLSITASFSYGATLPEHAPITILIVADEVNPHRLNDAQLTQPADLAPALIASDSPLNIAAIQTIDSQCIDAALEQLAGPERPDVLLYFAHRAAAYCNGDDAQSAFTGLINVGLQAGLGVVVLHHGLYIDFRKPGAKDDLLALFGARSNSIEWNTDSGQRVFNVGGEHFVSSNGLTYPQQTTFSGYETVAAGSYPYFDNIPDELYADTILLNVPEAELSPLFASDSKGNRLLGYALQRSGWQGRVVAYQPGEYQPNALDDRDGANFQILVNAIYFAAHR